MTALYKFISEPEVVKFLPQRHGETYISPSSSFLSQLSCHANRPYRMKIPRPTQKVIFGWLHFIVLGCSSALIHPQYASIEPITTQIPAVSTETALKRLERSRLYWKLAVRTEPSSSVASNFISNYISRLESPQYSYIRAIQGDTDSVHLTFISVEGGKPIVRGLGIIEPSRWFGESEAERTVRHLWQESRVDIGSHNDGAEALSIENLYDLCTAEILRPGAGPIRIYFHPSGVLMHCGRTKAECSDCKTVSIHAYSMNTLSPWATELDVTHWSCVESWGLVPLGATDWLRGSHTACAPPDLPSKTRQRINNDSLRSSCLIDPTLCPKAITKPTIYRSPLTQVVDLPVRYPLRYLEVGKADPDERLVVTRDGRIRLRASRDELAYGVGRSPEQLEIYSIESFTDQVGPH